MNSGGRLPVLDGLRAISIILVLACHMLPLGPKILKLNDAAGAMGMSLFFALSGFLITSTLLHNPDVQEFLVKRLARILPLAYGYTFIVFTFIYFDPYAAAWTSTFLINYVTRGMVDGLNNHFWSLCVEMQFYAAVALLVAFGGRKSLWIIFPVCLLTTLVRTQYGAYIAIQTHLRVDEILIGACVALLYGRTPNWYVPLPTFCAGLAAVIWFVSSYPNADWFQYLRPYATGLFLSIILGHRTTFTATVLSSRVMNYVATISYALYVIHPLTIYGWFNHGDIVDRYLLKRPLSFALTFSAAHFSTFYWEKFWMRAGRKWIETRRRRLVRAAF